MPDEVRRVKSAFEPRLINGPFGDPGLHIAFRWQGQAMQFDLGRMDRFPAADIIRLRHVFVSHTHMDHFYGFDRLLRLFLARDAALDLYGPPGIAGNVAGKIAGYTWNLADGYPFVLNVHEVSPEEVRSVRMAATNAFAPEEVGTAPFTGVLLDDAKIRVKTVHLDHRIPCMAYAIEEESHLNVDRDALEQLGVPAGRWLNDLKAAVRAGASDSDPIVVSWRAEGTEQNRTYSVGELRDRLLEETAGQKVAYVVDTLFSKENADKIRELAQDADVFYCESLFLNEDRHEATKRYHLTARQAGTLARMAGVKRLQVFHFSPRYEGRADRIYAEALAAFRGQMAPDVPS